MGLKLRREWVAALAVSATSAALLAGCGGVEGIDDIGSDEPDGFTVTMPDGFDDVSARRFEAFERQIEVGVEELTDADASAIDLLELWDGEIGGERIEIDIQTEDLPADGVDLDQYDELSRQTLEQIPSIQVEGTEPYSEFDGEEASVTDFTVPGVALGTVSIATTVRNGFAYNVELSASSPAARDAARPVLDEVIESWSWDE